MENEMDEHLFVSLFFFLYIFFFYILLKKEGVISRLSYLLKKNWFLVGNNQKNWLLDGRRKLCLDFDSPRSGCKIKANTKISSSIQ
jgi:hypothetical protein